MTGEPLPQHEIDQHAAAARDQGISCLELRAVVANLEGMRAALLLGDQTQVATIADFVVLLNSSIATFRGVLEQVEA